MMLDALRNTDDPGLLHPERLALSIDAPLPRRIWYGWAMLMGAGIGWAIIAAMTFAALVVLP